MLVIINADNKKEILSKGKSFKIPLPINKSEKAKIFKEYSSKSGVYVHKSAGKYLYVGSTTSEKWGTFGERLRREFLKKPSNNNKLYQYLKSNDKKIITTLFDYDAINGLIKMDCNSNIKIGRKVLIFEQVLIGVLKPVFNTR